MVSASIVVLSWNGAEVLPRTLPRLLQAVQADGGDHEVVVVDNGSTDATDAALAPYGSSLRIVRLETNAGVAGGFNAGLRHCSREVVVTLANDMLVDVGFLPPLLHNFAGPQVFAVSSKRLTAAGTVLHGQLRYGFDAHGLFDIIRPGLLQPDGPAVGARTATWYAPWANAAWRRDALESLGGFEERFGGALSWWAEADPSYRAWKRGWWVFFQPNSVVHHLDVQTGWRGFSAEEGDFWFKEGLLFFAWVGLTDREPLTRHLDALPGLVQCGEPWAAAYLQAARMLLEEGLDPQTAAARVAALPPAPPGRSAWPRALASMVGKLPWVVERRLRDRPFQQRTDAEVFGIVHR